MPPIRVMYLWDWFLELHHSRSVGFSPDPILYREVAEWAKLTNVQIRSYEVKAIMALDGAWISFNAKKQKKKDRSENKTRTTVGRRKPKRKR